MPAPVPPPHVSEHEVHVEGLDPRHDGVRIVQLSDLHIDRARPVFTGLAAQVNALHPDLLIFTGDSLNAAAGLETFRQVIR